MYYPAFLLPVPEGGYAVTFPDVPEALTQGATMDEALFMAQDALAVSLEEYGKAGKTAPKPSDINSLEEKFTTEMNDADVDSTRQGFIQMIPVPKANMRSIDVPLEAISAIDEKAGRLGLTRSDLLIRAVLEYAG